MPISHLRPAPGCGRKKVKMKPPWWRPRRARKNKKQIKLIALVIRTALVLLIACDRARVLTASYAISTSGAPPGRAGEISDSRPPPASSLPYFNTTSSPSSSLVIGSSYQNEIYLPCPIFNLNDDQTVSWIRKRDSLVLTIDKLRLVDDPRFHLTQAAEDWTLVLSPPSDSDAGHYECQVSSMEPRLSHLVELRMVPAESAISNFSSLFVRPNDVINLTCTIVAPQATSYVYWYKDKDVIHFDKLAESSPISYKSSRADPGKSRTRRTIDPESKMNDAYEMMYDSSRVPRPTTPAVEGTKYGPTRQQASSFTRWPPPDAGDANINNTAPIEQRALATSSSTLIIGRAQLNDTANYTCLPSNAKPSKIRVIVIENGLGNQPEKRSLHADSALSSLYPLPNLWFKKLKLLCMMTSEQLISWRRIDFGRPRTTETAADEPDHWPTVIIELFMDQSLFWMALSIGMAIHLGLVQ